MWITHFRFGAPERDKPQSGIDPESKTDISDCMVKKLSAVATLIGVCGAFSVAGAQEQLASETVTAKPEILIPAAAPQSRVQANIPYRTQMRLDIIAGRFTAVQAAYEVQVPINRYFSPGAAIGVGAGGEGLSTRLDLFGRFSLDPQRTGSWEPYIGGGLTTRYDSDGPGVRTYLLAFLGINGPKTGKYATGFEIGAGGGVRLGVTLRKHR